jgi:multidrug efflux pump subunit AcrA (membrane-fusion protein)
MENKFLSALLIVLVFTLYSCTKKGNSDDPGYEKGIEVEAVTTIKKTMSEYIWLNASTAFLNQQTIRGTFSGYLVKVNKGPGDFIAKGDLIFSIRTKEASAAENIAGAGQFSGIVQVFAHSSGVLTDLYFHEGDYITEGDRLALIAEPQSLRIVLNVPYQYSKIIHRQEAFSFLLADKSEMTAKVDKIMPSVDPVNQTQTFILKPDKASGIPANLNISVKVPLKVIKDAVALPKTAIVTDETQQEFWVMQIINESTAVKTIIKKGIESDGFVEILQPKFNPGDRFILSGGYGLPDTVKITIKK